MSLKNILKSDTKNQKWAHVYCDVLEANNIIGGPPVPPPDEYIENGALPTDLNIIPGAGTGAAPVIQSQKTVSGNIVTYNVSARIGGFATAPINAFGVYATTLTFDTKDIILFPVPILGIGNVNACVFFLNTGQEAQIPCSAIIRKQAGEDTFFRIDVLSTIDLFTPLAQRVLHLNMSFSYRR